MCLFFRHIDLPRRGLAPQQSRKNPVVRAIPPL
jgi:hypothetical protein